jgi:hypothetical protein
LIVLPGTDVISALGAAVWDRRPARGRTRPSTALQRSSKCLRISAWLRWSLVSEGGERRRQG